MLLYCLDWKAKSKGSHIGSTFGANQMCAIGMGDIFPMSTVLAPDMARNGVVFTEPQQKENFHIAHFTTENHLPAPHSLCEFCKKQKYLCSMRFLYDAELSLCACLDLCWAMLSIPFVKRRRKKVLQQADGIIVPRFMSRFNVLT